MKRMKRTISLMILAGMLTAGLASCVVKGGGEGSGEVPTGTQPIYQITTESSEDTNTPAAPTNDPTQVVYTAVDDVVYVASASASVKLVSDVTQTKNLKQLTELHRIGTSSAWCKVEYEEKEYYISAKLITTDDIGEKTFVECEKTLYTTDSLKIRPYASTNDTFAKELKVVPKATEVKVVAQSDLKGWSKVEVVYDDKTYNGFMGTKYLTTEATGEENDFSMLFTPMDSPAQMYVSVGQVAVRERPYKDGQEMGLLKENAAVTVLAKGTVEGMEWCAIEYETDTYETMNYFVAADCLSLVGGSVEQLLAFYDQLEKFAEPKTFYISADRVNVRRTPAVVEGNISETLSHKTQVKAIAMGTFTESDGSTSTTWCLVETASGKYGFVSYKYLTSNSDGTPAPAVLDLSFLLEKYGFTATEEVNKKFKVGNSGLYGEPTTTVECKKLAEGTVVKVVAQGETTTAFGSKNGWYIVEYQGYYYFALQKVLVNA